MDTNLLLLGAIAIHFLWHLVATIGVLYGLIHSYAVHGNKGWKILIALFWLSISLFLIIDAFIHSSHAFKPCS